MLFCKNLVVHFWEILGRNDDLHVLVRGDGATVYSLLLRAAIIGRGKLLTSKYLVINNRKRGVPLFAYAEYAVNGQGVPSGMVYIWDVDKENIYVSDCCQ